MSSARYKRLLTNLPSMAAIVNAFESPEVQLQVFTSLIDALDESDRPGESRASRRGSDGTGSEVEHDLVEGDSIHSIANDD
ncbi:MAG: hypothetical protein KDA58_06710 [Planctomycetaceae bacterium]|nr:hypothetical protein [Planctomycetaceae bacterium]